MNSNTLVRGTNQNTSCDSVFASLFSYTPNTQHNKLQNTVAYNYINTGPYDHLHQTFPKQIHNHHVHHSVEHNKLQNTAAYNHIITGPCDHLHKTFPKQIHNHHVYHSVKHNILQNTAALNHINKKSI